MKKEALILLCFVIMSGSVSAKGFLEESIKDFGVLRDLKCYENGAFSVTVTQLQDGNVYVSNFIKGVVAYHHATNETVDLNRYWYDQQGYWYDEEFHRLTVLNLGDKGIFVSDEYLLTKPGVYSLKLTGVPSELIKFFPDAKVYEYNFTCPGYKHSCKISPRILDCYSDGEFFHANISGLGYENFSKIDLKKDIKYSLNYAAYGGTAGYEVLMPNSTRYEKRGDYGYIRIPVDDLPEKIESLRIDVSGCIERLHKTNAYKSCEYFEQIKNESGIRKINATPNFISNSTGYKRPVRNITFMPEPEAESKVGGMVRFMYDMVPFKSGLLKDFLVWIGS